MFSKSVTYHNPFDDSQVTETLYFNLTVPEVGEFGFALDDDFENYIREVVEKDDRRKMFAFFKLIMAHAYGRRTSDGNGFAKKKEWLDELFSGLAYEELFIWIFTSGNNAAEFFNKVMPSKANMERVEQANKAANNEVPGIDPRKMTRDELERAFAAKLSGNKTASDEASSN